MKTEHFDEDPGWKGLGNRVVAKFVPTIKQDFGYSSTNFAGTASSEIGGKVMRGSRLAYYAARRAPRTLNDQLSATGTFTLRELNGGSVSVGWFNSDQPETARPASSLGVTFTGGASGGMLFVRINNSKNVSCSAPVHRQRGKYKPTPFRTDVRYHWTLDYDPVGAGGKGQIVYTLSGFKEDEPIDGRVVIDLPAGFKEGGATFNRFGIISMRKLGGIIGIYLDDLTIDGEHFEFTSDPQWEGVGNRDSYTDTPTVNDFGYSATHLAGGNKGEIGGTVFGGYGSYADRVGPLTLNQPLVAKGRVALLTGEADSSVFIGWFNSSASNRDWVRILEGKTPSQRRPTTQQYHDSFRDFVGVWVDGPAQIGQYFAPALWTSQGERALVPRASVLPPDGKPHEWSLRFDPAANEGRGALAVTFDGTTTTLDLKDKVREQGATLDRFGMFTSRMGGGKMKIWLDDLQYTAKTGGAR